MPVLLENPSGSQPLSIRDVAEISQRLAEDLSKLTIKSEGFTVDDYLSLDGPYFVEFTDGCIQVLPIPDITHQFLVFFLHAFLRDWIKTNDPAALVVGAPFKVFLRDGQYREPDVALMLSKHRHRTQKRSWNGADLAVEIISETNRRHDVETKRAEYAAGSIPEHWIVDPENRRVTVLKLVGTTYAVHGEFGAGDHLTSALLAGVSLDVRTMFDEAEAQA